MRRYWDEYGEHYEFDFSELGEALCWLRKVKGFTQAQLAEKLGVTQQQVSKMEHDRYEHVKWSTITVVLWALAPDVAIEAKLPPPDVVYV